MEENAQVMARKLWHTVRVAFFMLRKNISKRKLLLDLKYLATKRPQKLTHHHHHHHRYSHAPIHDVQEESEVDAVNRVLEMMLTVGNGRYDDVEGSPVLPGFGFGRSPVVRQLRVTDSPYPLQNLEEEEMGYYKVDEAAEEFIKRFYDQLRNQSITAS